jgi:hypothetical protein
MPFSKIFTTITFCCSLIIPFIPLKAAPQQLIQIDSIDKLPARIKTLRKESKTPIRPVIIFDCHGVLTKETRQKRPLHLKEGSKETLEYCKQEAIPFVVATAWDDFNDVQEGLIDVGLKDLLDIDPSYKAPLKTVALGYEKSVSLEGYKNGKLISLKYANQQDQKYFLQKMFAFEWNYPDEVFTHILAADDKEENLRTIEDDFPKSTHAGKNCELQLFFVGSNQQFSLSLSRSKDEDTSSQPLEHKSIIVTPEDSGQSSGSSPEDSGSESESEETTRSLKELNVSYRKLPIIVTPENSESSSEDEEEESD